MQESYVEEEGVDVNIFVVFLLLFVTPYILFYTLLVLITGEADLIMLYEAVNSESNMAFIKTWIIGSFILSFIGSMLISGAKIGKSVKKRVSRMRSASVAKDSSQQPHYTIETSDKTD